MPGLLPNSLFAQCKVCFSVTRHRDRLSLSFATFMPRGQSVAAIGNVVDLVAARFVADGEVRRCNNDDVSRHFWMNVAQQGDGSQIVEPKGALLALWPCPEIMP